MTLQSTLQYNTTQYTQYNITIQKKPARDKRHVHNFGTEQFWPHLGAKIGSFCRTFEPAKVATNLSKLFK